jgi:hypothetical protein
VIEEHDGCFNKPSARKTAEKGSMVMPTSKSLTGRSSGAYRRFHCAEMNSFCPLISIEIPKSGSLNPQIISIVSDVDDLKRFVFCVQGVEDIIKFIRNDDGRYFYNRCLRRFQ